jgi:integrase
LKTSELKNKNEKKYFLTTHELKNDKMVQRWLKNRTTSEETVKGYLQTMQMYTNFLRKSPTELILEAMDEMRVGAPVWDRNIETYIIDFRDYLSGKNPKQSEEPQPKLSATTQQTRLRGVLSFYKYCGIQLPVPPKSMIRATAELKRKVIPEKEDIQKLIPYCDPLEKALVLVGISSGLSAVDLANLKINNLSYDTETGITTIHIIRQKTNFEFHTFLTPEATSAVQEYLKYRNRTGRNVSESLYIKNRVESECGYLFIRRYVEDEYLQTRDEELRKFEKRSIIALYAELSNKAQMNAEKGEYNLIRTHNMRRYFYDNLEKTDIKTSDLEYMMAHAVDDTTAGYWRAHPKHLFEVYRKHMHALAIQKEFDPTESLAFQEMVKENEELKQIAATATVENEEIKALRTEIEKLKEDKQDMTEAHWESEADHMQEEKVSAHFQEVDMQKMQDQLNQQSALIAALTKKLGLDIDLDKPLTAAEKRDLKKTDW